MCWGRNLSRGYRVVISPVCGYVWTAGSLARPEARERLVRDQLIQGQGTEDIFNVKSSRVVRQTCPEVLWKGARRKLGMLNAAIRLDDLRVPRGNELEALKRDRIGQHSIRINEQYRVCFVWTDAGAERVEITDYH